VLALDRERRQFVRYIRNPANPHSLNHNLVRTLFEDAEGNFWVGTQSGVSRFNRKPRFINRQYEARNTQGLLADSIWAVQVDSQGTLWVGTARGRSSAKTGRAHSGLAQVAENSTGSIAQRDVSSPTATNRTTLPT
jgi:ligand-binding sensor domain-containing protein